MNKVQVELFMQDLNERQQKAQKLHLSVVRRYREGLLSYESYRELDRDLTKEIDTRHEVMQMFLYRLNEE